MAVGVELYQLNDENEYLVLGFASRVVHGPELACVVAKKELLDKTVDNSLKKFRTLILGYKIIIRTDHYALKFLGHCKLLNDRLTRWSLYLNEFDFEVEHVKGRDNVVADTLSRFPKNLGDITLVRGSLHNPIVASLNECFILSIFERKIATELSDLLSELKDKQISDSWCGPIYHFHNQYPIVLNKVQTRCINNFKLFNDLLYHRHNLSEFVLVIPSSIISVLILTVHRYYGHYGTNKLFNLLKRWIFYPKLRQEINHIIRTCDICQKTKHTNRTLCGQINPINATKPGELVFVDYFGPLPESRGKVAYILVVLDCFSKYVKLYPVRRATAKISVKKILDDFCKILPVQTILSDHGTQFSAHVWQESLKQAGIKVTFSSIRHPASNPVERVMRELGRLFRLYCGQSHAGWAYHVVNIEKLFNFLPHLSTGFSPNEILGLEGEDDDFIKTLRGLMPAQIKRSHTDVLNEVRNNLQKVHDKRIEKNNRNDGLCIDDYVLLREKNISDASKKEMSKFLPLYSGPYKIIAKPFPNVYTLYDLDKLETKGNYNISNLKFYHHFSEDNL